MQSLFGPYGVPDPVTQAIEQADIAIQAGPWRHIVTRAIGGLTAVGFDRSSETMLVCSMNGQSVIDAETGEIVYRNRDDDGLDISALKGTRVIIQQMSGLIWLGCMAAVCAASAMMGGAWNMWAGTACYIRPRRRYIF